MKIGHAVTFIGDESRTDPYGRQVERETSIVHESAQPADGMFWRAI